MTTTRRSFIRIGGLTAAGAVAAACAPAAAPPAPGAAPAGGSAPAGKAAWEKEWDDLVAAAKKEGKLGILTLVGGGYRKALDEFEKLFGITVDQQAAPSATVWLPKLQKEREAGVYELDNALVPPNSALVNIRGAWAPLKPVLFRPDVTDDKVWREGFSARFMDVDKQLCFDYEYIVQHVLGFNTDLVKDGEITSAKDLLNPKWKGKIIMSDPRFGDGYLTQANVRKNHGNEVVKQLLVDQEPVFSRDPRQIAEAVIRGKNPVGIGMRVVVLKEFKDQGLTKSLKLMDMPDMDFVPATSLFLVNKAPHPNAAKLFANWFLTKEGQTVFGQALPMNSSRTDLQPFDLDSVGTVGKKYYETGHEANFDWIKETQGFINTLTGLKNVGN